MTSRGSGSILTRPSFAEGDEASKVLSALNQGNWLRAPMIVARLRSKYRDAPDLHNTIALLKRLDEQGRCQMRVGPHGLEWRIRPR